MGLINAEIISKKASYGSLLWLIVLERGVRAEIVNVVTVEDLFPLSLDFSYFLSECTLPGVHQRGIRWMVSPVILKLEWNYVI